MDFAYSLYTPPLKGQGEIAGGNPGPSGRFLGEEEMEQKPSQKKEKEKKRGKDRKGGYLELAGHPLLPSGVHGTSICQDYPFPSSLCVFQDWNWRHRLGCQ